MRVLPRPLEVPVCPPVGRAALAAPKKKMQEGGALWGSGHGCFAGGGSHPCTGVSEGGVEKLLVG